MLCLVKPRRKPGQAGVTLIEMLVVVAIIALFAVLVAPPLLGKLGKAQRTAAQAQVKGFLTALGAYRIDVGTFPTPGQGLAALRHPPPGVANWDGPYLPGEVPLDPWGHAYVYRFPGEFNNEPAVASLGADGAPGGDGDNADIVSWKN